MRIRDYIVCVMFILSFIVIFLQKNSSEPLKTAFRGDNVYIPKMQKNLVRISVILIIFTILFVSLSKVL